MLLDLVDSLRCTEPHESSWLVLSADRWDGRHIASGRLGCPVCRSEYPIVDGVADFTRGLAPPVPAPLAEPDESAMLRLAAQLDLTEPGGVVVLAGAYAPLAGMLAESFPALYAVLNGVASSGAVSALAVSNGQPFAAGSVRAVALDAAHAGLITEAHRMLRTGGRLVASADAAPGDGLQVIARDERELVALSTGSATPVIPLRRR